MAIVVRDHEGLRPRQYVLLGVILTVLTAAELLVSYSGWRWMPLVTTLIVLSATKFALVVAFFMHLRFESSLLTRLFVGCFALASVILLSLLALFVLDLR
ncbi:MAG: cytochrome C oxidase subunit IV family protein [Dehalococcoidia bacterium]